MELIQNIALGAGLAWAGGIRLYAVLFLTGLLSRLGYLDLPDTLDVLSHPAVLWASGVMFVAEFLADKIPAFDSVWDAVHTFIRIPAGALLAAGSLGHMDPVYLAVAAILGGVIASTSHATKAGSRALINTSPEPFSNWAASLTEDFVAPLGLLAAINYPYVFLALLVVFIVVAAVMLRFLIRAIRTLLARVRQPGPNIQAGPTKP